MARLIALVIFAAFAVSMAVFLWPDSPMGDLKSAFGPTPHARIARDPQVGGFRLEEDFYFTDAAGFRWKAPRGTLTDGASIPQPMLAVFGSNFSEKFLDAAVVHDAYCGSDNSTGESYRQRSRREVHRMFYEAALVCGANAYLAKMMYAGIMIGGPTWDFPPPPRGRGETPAFAPDRVLTAPNSDQLLRQELVWADEWIKAEDPGLDQVDQWSENRREQLDLAVLLANLQPYSLPSGPAEGPLGSGGLGPVGEPIGGGLPPTVDPAPRAEVVSVDPPDWIRTRQVVGKYCLRCHGPEAAVKLHDMRPLRDDPVRAAFWKRTVDLFRSNVAHPDQATAQPEPEEKAVVIRWVEGQLGAE